MPQTEAAQVFQRCELESLEKLTDKPTQQLIMT